MASYKRKVATQRTVTRDTFPLRITGVAIIARQTQSPVMPTGRQIRAARAFLGWTIQELANRAGVAMRTIQRAEDADTLIPPLHVANLEKIKTALEAAGIEFLPANQSSPGGGIRLNRY